MIDPEQFAALQAAVADLQATVADVERRLAAHENMRSGAIDALRSVSERVAHLQQRMIGALPPEVEASRQMHWLEQAAVIKTRLRAVEEWLRELAQIVIEHHEAIQEIVDMLKRGRE